MCETAHPGKFAHILDEMVGNVEIPDRLRSLNAKSQQFIELDSDYNSFKDYLLSYG